jgi:phospholipase D-like protein
MFGIGPLEFLFVLIIGSAIWAVFDIFRQPRETFPPGVKSLWVLTAIAFPIIGPIVYIAAGKPRRASIG